MTPFQRVAAAANSLVRPLVTSRLGRPFEGWMTVVSYIGRRSGRSFSIPVGYTRRGDDVTIRVEFPDKKTWWRNFLGDGGPIAMRLHGVDRPGHATAGRDGRGKVTVTVRLEPEPG